LANLKHRFNLPILFPGIAMRFTVKTTDALRLAPGARDKIWFDDDIAGWGLRIREGGKRVWIYQYAIGGRTRRLTFGAYPAMSVTTARGQAEQLHAQTKLGRDPAREKADSKARAGETFGHCLSLYLRHRRAQGKLRATTLSEIERHLNVNLRALHDIGIDKLDRRSIAAEIGRLTERGPVQANRTRASVIKFLNWCAGEGYIDSNPAQLINKNPEHRRGRLLSVDELASIWRALPAGDFGDILRLLTLLGQRRDEIALLEWKEIDLDRGVIALPASKMKNRLPHVVHLGPTATAILQARDRSERSLVFGTGHGGFSGWSQSKARLDAKLEVEPWVIHDLRRAVSTHMNELGVMPHIVEAVLGHVSGSRGGVAGVYNLAAYEPDKRAAMHRWDGHLMAAIEGRDTNISPPRRA
jgi:integrase